MKIAIIAQSYHPCVGGVETHARQIARQLGTEHQVTVIAVNFDHCRLPPRLAVLHTNLLAPSYRSYHDGTVPVCAMTPSRMDRVCLLPTAIRAVPKLQRYAYHRLNHFGYRFYRAVFQPRLQQLIHGAHVVHSLAGGYLGWTAQAAARDLSIPFLCTPFVHPGRWGDGADDIAYYKAAQGVVALVETDKQYLCSLGIPEAKIHVIGVSPDLPPSADGSRFRRKHRLEGAIVLYVGRVVPQKGARTLLDSAPDVWKESPDTHFVFIGPAGGAEANWFKDVDSRIRYLGPVDAQEKADALAACDLFCMPSVSEILPTVYLEAWSFGKPVVGGKAAGLTELVEGNQAGFASNQQPPELAYWILKLLHDRDLSAQLGARGKRLVEEKYSITTVAGALARLYSRLLQEPRRVQ